MRNKNSWKKLSSKIVYQNRWISVSEDIVVTNKGRKLTYGVVHKKPFVLIIPWDGRHFTLVGQYRYAVNEFSWEFPQGHHHHGSIKKTALTELQEETGQKAGVIKRIGSFWIGPGMTDQECIVFFATDLTPGKPNRDDSEEDMRTWKLTHKKMRQLIKNHVIKDGVTITALSLADYLKLINKYY